MRLRTVFRIVVNNAVGIIREPEKFCADVPIGDQQQVLIGPLDPSTPFVKEDYAAVVEKLRRFVMEELSLKDEGVASGDSV